MSAGISAAPSASATVAYTPSAIVRKSATRADGSSWPRRGTRLRECCDSRSSTARRRAGSSPFTPRPWRMRENSTERWSRSAIGAAVLPLVHEGRPLGGRKIAEPRPATGKRQARHAGPAARPQPQGPIAEPRRQPIKRRPLGQVRPQLDPVAHSRRLQVPLELPLAPMPHHGGQWNLHRAHLFAAPAEGRGVGQLTRLVDADQRRRENRSHRTRIDPAIGVAADCLIDRAMIETGAAANAAQHRLPTRRSSDLATMVEQDHVIFLRPVGIIGPPRTGREGGVARHLLAGRRACQEPQQRRHILERRHQLVDRREHQMRLRQDLGEVAIALIGDDDRGAGFRHQEIRPGDAEIGANEFLPQHQPRLVNELGRLVEIALARQVGMHPAEIGFDLIAGQMHGGSDDVARMLAAQLDDVLPEIGLDRLDAGSRQRLIELDLLADHGLALGDAAGAEPSRDLDDDPLGLRPVGGEMDMAAARPDLGLVALEIEIEMGERVVLDRPRLIAERLELRQPVARHETFVDEAARHVLERPLQLRIMERPRGILLEFAAARLHQAGSPPPMGGPPVSPASTSAMWRTSMRDPSRDSLPAMFIRHPRSPASSTSAPLAVTLAIFFFTMSLEISGYLTQKVPPKPQHTSASFISATVSPLTSASSRRGWLRMSSSRKPEQLS